MAEGQLFVILTGRSTHQRRIVMTEWQPIETAPKDNTLVLLYSKIDPDPDFSDFMGVGYWETYDLWHGPIPPKGPCWMWSIDEHLPTHWMHLPEPPQ